MTWETSRCHKEESLVRVSGHLAVAFMCHCEEQGDEAISGGDGNEQALLRLYND